MSLTTIITKPISLLSRIKKRRRFILSTIFATIAVTTATFFGFQNIIFVIPCLIFVVYFLTFFSILEDITEKEWLMLFLHPVLFTVALYLFYFFLPARWLTRLPFAILYSISFYAIILSQNIFNVGVDKSLQLFRAAFSVNFLFLTISTFMGFSLLMSFHQYFFINGVVSFLIVFPAVLQFLWSVNPTSHIELDVVKYALFVSIIVGEAATILSFVPINPAMFALFLTALFYSLSGLFQAHLQKRLFREVVREYAFVLMFISGIVLLSLQW